MNTLTDRYVAAVLRRIPEKQRTDIDSELRTSIEDAIEGRVATGATADEAERAVLVDLGDPQRLAADYSGAQLQLIGPGLYLEWRSLLGRLLAIVVPIATAVTAVVGLVTGDGVGAVIAGSITTSITVALHIAFWTTLVFAIIERSGVPETASPLTGEWTPDDLPDQADPGDATLCEAVGSGVFLVLVAVAVVVQQFVSSFRRPDGTAIPLLDPDLWTLWLPYVIVVLLASAVLPFAAWRAGRWTFGLATLDTVVKVAFTVPVVVLAWSGELLNPAWFDAAGWAEGAGADSWLAPSIAISVVVTFVWGAVDIWVRAIRSARRGAVPLDANRTQAVR